MSLGPVMLDLQGPELSVAERELLGHPAVGGVILFSRNYASPPQLAALTRAIHDLREPRLLVATDQEGGRVQRFRKSFTRLPAPAALGRLHERDPAAARRVAHSFGLVLAAELRAVGVDFSLAPLLDLERGRSGVIGDRALHRDPDVVAALAQACIRGMHAAGMGAVGKHFPGHGSVEGDSHLTTPVDRRPLASLRLEDMLAFERVIRHGIAGIMPAHVVYAGVDPRPAGFSSRWLKTILREELGFQGAVFSDDICMSGAAVAGDLVARARAALDAGCDMVLVCNDRRGAEQVLERLAWRDDSVARARLARLHGRGTVTREQLAADGDYRRALAELATLVSEPELDLGDDAPV